MLPSRTGLSREGLPYILLFAFLTLIFAILSCVTMTAVMLVVTVLAVNFFRDPERYGPEDETLAVAPADGKVVKVERMTDPFTGESRTAVCIFMNIFNVHVNRVPVAGSIERLRYHPGKYFNASLDKASTHNERMTVGLVDEEGRPWTVVQIAGLVARRIVCHAEPRDVLARGERFGLIKFGSRVDVYLPEEYVPLVRVGEKTLAGQTPIAAPTRK